MVCGLVTLVLSPSNILSTTNMRTKIISAAEPHVLSYHTFLQVLH